MSVVERPARTATGRTRLTPRARKALLLTHVLASVALVGEVWALVVLNLTATLTGDPGLAEYAYRLQTPLVFAGGIPLSMISLASGITLGLGTHWGVLRHVWVAVKLLLLVATILVGALLSDPEALAAAAEVTARRQWEQNAEVAVQFAMLLAATALSIYKPRGRLPRRRPRNGSAARD
ncbi:hypothetical protein [Thermomonospora amylolytica]|uniref:hypothetical protein n=1 Tax=Thermomonospora amylolytica TaxID=1411117 RepID=UPI000E6D2698|nr:hypothetical protein [Thermomonospora amylolytica]